MKPNPVCVTCKLVNIVFEETTLPMDCLFCGNPLKEDKEA